MEYSALPNCTLHLRRVDPERLNNDSQILTQKARLTTLCNLMQLTPVDINIKRSIKRKGQAFITFSSPADAAKAMEMLQGFQMVKGGRGMEVELANGANDELVKEHCDEGALEEHIRARKADKDRKRALELAAPAPIKKHPLDPISGPGKPTKTPRTGGVIPDEYLPPNNVLFVREVPEEYDLDALTALFQRYTGFREVRIVPLPSFKGTAFVEYEANEGAIQAREALNGRELGSGGKALKVTYQKAG